jgi:hypothetical protein
MQETQTEAPVLTLNEPRGQGRQDAEPSRFWYSPEKKEEGKTIRVRTKK